MDQIQIVKQQNTEQPVYHLQTKTIPPVNYFHSELKRPIQYYQYSIPMCENQSQQYQKNHQGPIQQETSKNNNYCQQQFKQESLINQPEHQRTTVSTDFENERPMMLNAWTQTRSEDFPILSLSSNHGSEKALLARIQDLETRLKSQNDLLCQLQEDKLRTPSPRQEVPNSTTSTPRTSIQQKGTRYRILTQSNEATSDEQFEIEITDSDRLEICMENEFESNPSDRPDLRNATVSIGPNGTRIPVNEYEKMSWTQPSLATRKLLSLVFDRETLATHSMTGKASPAFKDLNKPTKGKLDPNAVEDIIFIASKKCGVSPKEIRAAITTKCADENKMCKLKALKKLEKSSRSALREFNKSKYGALI